MIFRAPEPDVAIPDVALTPLLLASAAGRGDKAALVDGPTGRTMTYRAWADGTRRAAAGLASRGFRKGDVFAIYSPNLPEYAIAFHAVSLAGGVITTINPQYTVAELSQQLRDAGARYLITVPPCVEKAEEAARDAGVQEVFVFGESDRATPFAALLAASGDPPAIAIDPRNDLVALPYSSGTTGLPKGVILTHHNLVANLVQSEAVFDLRETDVLLGVLPFFHIYGMTVIMNMALYVGATVVTMPRFDLEQCLAAIEKYQVTYANVVPPIVLALAKHPLVDKYRLGSLRYVCSGAAPLKESVAEAASARIGCMVVQGYGLTETSPVTHAARVLAKRVDSGSIGPPIPNTEVKVVDVTTGAELAANQEGEICIRGPQVMRGYLNRPEATREMIDSDGWLHTGDIGYADDHGFFFIVDRLKELIKYKGLQIAPAELEAVLLGHPSVADAAVIPIEDEHSGQVPKAFVVLKDEASAEPDIHDTLLRYVADRVAPYKKVRVVEVTKQIPKSPSGKILRRVLVEQEIARASSRG
jgi:acyl-CoA synthetase (AMP-forming)/AMP-acid ligase II